MKVRYGFVTNSSSSSFILAFESDEEIQNLSVSKRVREELIEDNEYEVQDVLDEYRTYIEGNLYNRVFGAIRDRYMNGEYGHNCDYYYSWAKEHPEEYKSICDEMYQKYGVPKVAALERKLKNKSHIFMIDEGDETSAYKEYYTMKQKVAMMDFH